MPQKCCSIDTFCGDSKVVVEIQDSRNIPESEDSKIDDENVAENLDQKAEVNQMSKEESSQPTIEVRTDSASEGSKMDDKLRAKVNFRFGRFNESPTASHR